MPLFFQIILKFGISFRILLLIGSYLKISNCTIKILSVSETDVDVVQQPTLTQFSHQQSGILQPWESVVSLNNFNLEYALINIRKSFVKYINQTLMCIMLTNKHIFA